MQFKKHVVTRTYDNYGSQAQDYLELVKELLCIPVELWTVFKRHMSELKNNLCHTAKQLQGGSNMQDSESENQG